MSTAERILPHLDKVRHTGPSRWVACCPAHADKHPSLAIRELDDGRTLLHCFAGCTAGEVLTALGLDFGALFPEQISNQGGGPERRPFPASDVLRCLGLEATFVLVAAKSMVDGKPIDCDRLMLAASRIQAGLDLAGVNHG